MAQRLPDVLADLLMQDRERAVRSLSRLRDDGVGVAIDDYGAGYPLSAEALWSWLDDRAAVLTS